MVQKWGAGHFRPLRTRWRACRSNSERKNFQRIYDLAERVIPEEVRAKPLTKQDGIEVLLLKALDGHGWATTGTLASTWRLKNNRAEIAAALRRLVEEGKVMPCAMENPDGRVTPGWIRPEDRELAARLETVRPRRYSGVLLSPFDPLLWDRARVRRLFGFDQVLEIFKPAAQRTWLLLPAGALGGATRRPPRPQGRPQEGRAARPVLPI